VFSAHSPIKFSRSAVGLLAIHDEVGVTNQYSFAGTYAYHIPVSRLAKVSVGAQAGVTYYRANYNDLDIISSTGQADPSFANSDSRFLPNLGIGAYYYTKRFYFGLSLPTLINNRWNNIDPLLEARQQRHYFISSGYIFALNRDLKLKPNILLKWVEHGPVQLDINANLLIRETVWVGVSYRTKDSVDGILQYNINDQFSLGYSFGYPVNGLSSLQSGTHEIVINYRIKKNKHIVLSPRYF
jgi:type IX secretion system PorP/SprF family membrane protein